MSQVSSTPLPPPLSLVLDTNVALDLLVFDDPAVRPLVRALEAGEATAWADGETLAELEYVLAYPSFALDEAARRAAQERYRGLVRIVEGDLDATLPPLPRCRDRSDQKFLVLAARARATWLVSKDKRLLSLADRPGLPFGILTARQLAGLLDAQHPRQVLERLAELEALR
ncbi:PIN domain-containing protein [Archangium violaceum]|uniref:PIN domain-containing protein n=1 Tax=Archangium violaceum TaxID=83451 RepID=UPI00193BBF77|nr:PIN domain-containing protein [Archangium violaceum]QRK07067.1 PIN domain-containing protein [Archangium violaceum]